MADDDDRVTAAGDRGSDAVRGRSWCEVGEGDRLAEAEPGRGLPRTQQRAGQHGVRRNALRAQAFPQLAGLFVASGCERAQLVRISRRRFRVANEHEPHTGAVGYLCGFAALRVADVFTDTALTGNQLAVFTDGRGLDDDTMQKLAKEMNYSE